MPCFRHTSAADSPAACSFSTLIICSSVNLLLRMSVSRRNGLYSKSGTSTGSRSVPFGDCDALWRCAFQGDDFTARGIESAAAGVGLRLYDAGSDFSTKLGVHDLKFGDCVCFFALRLEPIDGRA